MKNLITICLLVCSVFINAQTEDTPDLKKETFHVYFGRSFHGSGDIRGFAYGLVYERSISKRWITSLSFDSSLNDSEQRLFIFEDPNGNIINSTQHDVVAGFQLTAGLGYRFINNKRHRFALHPGILFRYQASSLNDIETTLFPGITGFPIPIRIIENYEQNRTFAVGGALRLHYDYVFNSKYILGLQGAWQIDTNGDAFAHWGLRFGVTL